MSRYYKVFIILISLLVISMFWAAHSGAISIMPSQAIGILFKKLGISTSWEFTNSQEQVLSLIRLPRVFLAILIGATLAVNGCALQGLFRNPLADPGLIGVSSGGAAAAALVIVFGSQFLGALSPNVAQFSLNIFTFIGAMISMLLVYRIAQQNGKINVGIMLLAGIAINSLSGAFTSFITISATEPQLRTITFWLLGSLGGANWTMVITFIPFALISIIGMPIFAKALNALSLGEQDASYLGIPIERSKTIIMIICALGVGATVAIAGIISFVGLVVPHIIRLILGPEHGNLLRASTIGGAILLLSADTISRTVAAPIEIPIGIITAFIGAPFFLYLLYREKKLISL